MKSARKAGMIFVSGAMLTMSGAAWGAVANGDFETGDTSLWTPIGQTHVATAGFGVIPTDGIYMGELESTGNFTATGSVLVASLGLDMADFIAMAQGVPVNGSAITQSVTVNAGDVMSYKWNFLSDELDEDPEFNDFTFLVVDGDAYLLTSKTLGTFGATAALGFDGETGWQNGNFTFTAGGSHEIGWASVNVGDAGHNSVLLLDSIVIPVPEPASLGVIGIGALMLLRRRR
jgi:hypothetical protein